MAQCAMQMRATLGSLRGETPHSCAGGGATSKLASVSQGWRSLNVTQLRVAATSGRVIRERISVAVRAAEEPNVQGDDMSGFGLGGKGSFFGFGRFQELQVGRLAMIGWTSECVFFNSQPGLARQFFTNENDPMSTIVVLAAAVVMEVITGKGVLGQLGINPSAVKGPLLAGLLFLLVGGLLGGYVVINNPPDISKAPPNEGDGLPRNPLQTYDAKTLDPLTTYTRGGVVDRPSGQKGKEPYVSDLDLPPKK